MNGTSSYRTDIIRAGWKIGNFWYFEALNSPKGLYNIFRSHIQLIFASSHNVDPEFPRILSEYWTEDVEEFINAKLQDKEVYEKKLRLTFEDASKSI